MAKSKPTKSSKHDIKATIIIVLLCIIGVLVFMLLSKEKQKPIAVTMPVKGLQTTMGEGIKPKKIFKPTLPPVPVKKMLPGSAGTIAFIIDDWGQSMRNCKYLKSIEAPLAVAVLPDLPHSDDIMKCAQVYSKTIMLHLPMEPYQNNDRYPTDYLLKASMKPSKVDKILESYLNKMPLAEGVNNHMGSKATEDAGLMKVVLRRLKKRGLFFVDSLTAPHQSVGAAIAAELHVPFTQRDVFLDNVNSREEILRQMEVLTRKARKNGSAIAIGHDRELTMQIIKEQIPVLEAQGFTIVSVKQLLKHQ